MTASPDLDYLRVIGGSDCRFSGNIRTLGSVARATAAIDMGHMCGATLSSDDMAIEIGGTTWEGVACYGTYLLLQQRSNRARYMLTSPNARPDHHCRTIEFAATVEDAEDGEGVTEDRELLQQVTAVQAMLTAKI